MDRQSFIARQDILTCISKERFRQQEKRGDQGDKTNATWFLILGEETGEVARAVLENDLTHLAAMSTSNLDLFNELIQVAAVAAAWAENVRKKTYPNES